MKKTILIILSFTSWLLFNELKVWGQKPKPEQFNVIWNNPVKNSSGSMPLGNGDIGLNLWVEENGDLFFFISKTDAWSDCGRLLKLGQVRLRLTPSLAARPFRQELQLQNGAITVSSGARDKMTKLRIWVDANRPVIHIEGDSRQNIKAEVTLQIWRTKDRDLQHDNSAAGVTNGGIPIIETADEVLPQKENRITWYHRNKLTIFPLTMKVQGLENLMSLVPDPLLNSTFGGTISGKGLIPADAADATQSLKTAAPTSHLEVTIPILTAQTATPELWLEKLNEIIITNNQTGLKKSWSAHCNWWKTFWNRSWIYVQTPEDRIPTTPELEAARMDDRDKQQLMGSMNWNNRHDRDLAISVEPAGRVLNSGYALQRFIMAASGRGAYPIKFNGSIFTVNTRDPKKLSEADYRSHGPNYWWQNTRLPYWPMLRSGDYEMMLPLFSMYRAMVPMATERTKIYYKHEGIFFPETLYPWGVYPNDEYGWAHNGPPGFLQNNVHIRYYWSGGLELTAMMLDYYDGTQDKEFLRDTLLPIADGVATFFDQHWKRDEKGKIRFDPACALEASHVAVNPLPEIAGLRYILPRLLALSPDYTTAAQRAAWAKTLRDLPEIPIGDENGKKILLAAEWMDARPGDEFPELYAVFPYRLFAIGNPDLETGLRTFEKFVPVRTRNVYPFDGLVGAWRQSPIQAAFLGKTDQAARMIVSNFSAHHRDSRFPTFWGPGHDYMPDQCHGGVSMMTLQSMLLQTDGRKIYLFPAWPKTWDVNFKLHAPYNTIVEGEFRDGKLRSLKVTPKSRIADMTNMTPN